MALQPQVLGARPAFAATRSRVESLNLKGNAYQLQIPGGEKGVSRGTLQRGRREVLVEPTFIYLFANVCAVCTHMCVHMSACVRGPKVDKGYPPSLLFTLLR